MSFINHVNHPITVSKMSEGIKIHLLNILKSQGLSFKAGQLPFLDYGGKELTLIPSTLFTFRWNFRFLPIILPHVPDPRTCRVKDPQTVKVHTILPRMSCKIDNVGYVAPRSSEFSEPTTRILENTAISISVTRYSYRLTDKDTWNFTICWVLPNRIVLITLVASPQELGNVETNATRKFAARGGMGRC